MPKSRESIEMMRIVRPILWAAAVDRRSRNKTSYYSSA
jgi:hypothetical protein